MNELTNSRSKHANSRWQLLATVSALALLGVTGASNAKDAEGDADRPTIWIELGAQIDRIDGGQEAFAPPFTTSQPRPSFQKISPLEIERLPRYGLDMDGKISFEPEGTDWVFTAAVRYGRSNGNKHAHEQTPGVQTKPGNLFGTKALDHVTELGKFADTKAKHNENHTVLDFMAGKDVGLGIFGHTSRSVFNFGVRFAQFGVQSHVQMSSNPDTIIKRAAPKYQPFNYHHTYRATQQTERNFRGLGPSISWDASAPVLGNSDIGGLALDWGLNAAVLFGRQKADTSHQTSGFYFKSPAGAVAVRSYKRPVPFYQKTAAHVRTHSVVVPNVGGFAGVSFRYPNAKVSFGYRADMFFGAIDGGADARSTYNRSFYGPFATISVGLGG